MTVLIFAIVIGWIFSLENMIKTAGIEAGILAGKPAYSALAWASFVPIIAFAGFCFPRIFLGGELVRRLKEHGIKRRWFNCIRAGVAVYLALLVGIPVGMFITGLR